MTSNLPAARGAPNPDEATDIQHSFRALLRSPIATTTQADEVSAQISAMRIPATRKWISGRVATLLSQYYASSVPSEMMAAIAEDWHDELQAYPAWAIQKACRWWMSADNPERRKRPMPGDIAVRAKHEVAPVVYAERDVARFRRGAAPMHLRDAANTSPQPMAELLDKAGFRPRRFGGGQ